MYGLLIRTLAELHVSPGNLPGNSGGGGSGTNTTSSEFQTILTFVFGVIGALSILMITIAGLRYITSAGDPQKAAGAKSALVYALIGLAIAISAEGIVAFVAGKL
ncbi:MAG: hypothetical protein ACREGB_04340 [Candidatus Saccharimonadales bacterium]